MLPCIPLTLSTRITYRSTCHQPLFVLRKCKSFVTHSISSKSSPDTCCIQTRTGQRYVHHLVDTTRCRITSGRLVGTGSTTIWTRNLTTDTAAATDTATADTTVLTNKPKAVFINASRLNYDNKLDFTEWDKYVQCTYQPYDRIVSAEDSISTDPIILSNYVTKIMNLIESNTQIVIVKEIYIPKDVIPLLSTAGVQLICEAGTGYNNIPIKVARDYNITVCNTPSYSTDAVAHMVITYLLNFSCSMIQQQLMIKSSNNNNNNNNRSNFTGPFTLPLHEINNKTIGLIGGTGRIGTTVAQIALALKMNIIISSRSGTLPSTHILYNNSNVICTNDVSYLLKHSDYVSIHTPLNNETKMSFGRTEIELMKPTAYLINTSRGAIINENELINCLQNNTIAGAGLDVTIMEPPCTNSLLWTLPNVYLSPHTGWRRIETRQRLIDYTLNNLHAFITATSSNDYINVVN